MKEKNEHVQLIEKWANHALSSTSHDEVVRIFNQVFAQVWSQAELVLGVITIRATAGRVFALASEIYPWINPSMIGREGLKFSDEISTTDLEELKLGVRFILAEFLTVLGNLTANVISPKLHALVQTEAMKGNRVGSEALSRNDDKSQRASARARNKE